MAKLFQQQLFFLAGCTENQLRRQIEFLKAENEMLRKRVPKKRIFLNNDERNRLLKLGKAIGPGVCHLITIVHPRTFRRWISEKNAGNAKKKMGRPKTLGSIREIVVRIAKETGWGYGRILGELKKRIRPIAQSTIKNILKEEGMLPRPNKGPGSWDEFLKMHAETLCQIDFFSKCVWTRSPPDGAIACDREGRGARRIRNTSASLLGRGRARVFDGNRRAGVQSRSRAP